jgi:PAS domain S-box-containing protein
MQIKDLKTFEEMPFNMWVKDEQGKYLWANRAVSQLAGEDVVGKTDRELIWAADAPTFQANDKKVFQTGKPNMQNEHAAKTSRGEVTVSSCKWLGKLDGHKGCFGISFVVGQAEKN